MYILKGVPPKALESKPDLPDILVPQLEHFLRLSERRDVGLGSSPILYSEILSYCELYNIPEDGRREFTELIVAVDINYSAAIKAKMDRNKSAQADSKPKAKKR